MRKMIAYLMIAAGFALMIAAYFFLAAPWGFPPSDVEFSDPRLPFAPGMFIIGFLVVFLAAVVYEILPEKWGK